MLEILFSLVHDATHYQTRQKTKSNRNYKEQRNDRCLFLLILVLLEDRVRVGDQLKLKVISARGRAQNSFVHELRVSDGHILTRGVHIVYHFEFLRDIVGLVN